MIEKLHFCYKKRKSYLNIFSKVILVNDKVQRALAVLEALVKVLIKHVELIDKSKEVLPIAIEAIGSLVYAAGRVENDLPELKVGLNVCNCHRILALHYNTVSREGSTKTRPEVTRVHNSLYPPDSVMQKVRVQLISIKLNNSPCFRN